jgi:hypothetical protein
VKEEVPVSKLTAAKPSAAHAPAPAAASAPATKKGSWVEDYVTRVYGARTFLRGKGCGVTRASEDRSTWFVSGWGGEFTNEQLVELAVSKGFAP